MTEFAIEQAASQAKQVAPIIASLATADKNNLLHLIATQINESKAQILSENSKDIRAAKSRGLSEAMIDRLLLTEARIDAIATAICSIAELADPVGEKADIKIRPNGIEVSRMRIPLGVIAMIYEARPNVTAEAAALCIKSGNVVVLRGGSEAIHSNLAIAAVIKKCLLKMHLPEQLVTIIPDTSRDVIAKLLTLNQYIDLVIPRGGEGLIRYVTDHARIPVIQHFKGVCHLFIDKFADTNKAIDILINGKAQRPSACNAIETLLIHRDIATEVLPKISEALAQSSVTVHACGESLSYFSGAALASEQDYHAEYLALELAIKVVNGFDQAIEHIRQFGSDHTEVIVTQDITRAQRFVRNINSSVVMVNASSRFSDGGELGLGSEIGISTSRLHAYGPMGLQALTTQKYVVIGDGQVRQ
ncbi:glutamate-5-semialdehyde dehydrogenase [Thalassotalea maritima]|uniref:glutamate-5-semialdehyde dehydrogenase n=1 Tax=Thalassotalea maritima TaxID=3242416 RepID=UPI003526F936